MTTLPTVRELGHNGDMAPATSSNGNGVGSSAASATTTTTTSRTERKLAVLKKLRAPPLTHEWEFWHDRHSRDAGQPAAAAGEGADYGAGLAKLILINNVQTFWETFNNFPLGSLVLRDSVHLFKKTVKPVWEDRRNVRGGSWTLRVPKQDSAEVWKNIQLMAIGEVLQDAVEPGDDICGVSMSIRFNSHLISIWNRDGSNEKSINAILAVVLEQLPEALRPPPQNYYYKKHSEHKGFSGEGGGAGTENSAAAAAAAATATSSAPAPPPPHINIISSGSPTKS